MPNRPKRKAANALVAWFLKNQRPMPWRLRPEPYFCWLSEIMLQQTTYEQALPYYKRFLRRFPTVEKLSAASEQTVLKVWEGLGYYARARNLLKAARRIVSDGWPCTYADWLALPGIGPYTAAALSSVLNGVREPVVDGNVARVFARFWHLQDDFKDPKARGRLAERLRGFMPDRAKPGDFNQAMMELGALVCMPSNPNCAACPLARECAACAAGDALEYPRNARRTGTPTRRRTFLVVPDGTGRVLLVQNSEGGLLQGLWELPSAEPGAEYRQAFSHFKLEASVWQAPATPKPQFKDPAKVPLTTAARRILMRGILALALGGATCASAAQSYVLAERGTNASYTIVLPQEPSPTERFAADELRHWTQRLTDVSLPESTHAPSTRGIFLKTVFDYGPDGFCLKTRKDGSLEIAGGVRGVLYGVYELLETYGGIGWFASYVTEVPATGRLAVPSDLHVIERPAFVMREQYFYDVSRDGDFAARLRLNGNFCALGARHGGKVGTVGAGLRSHTFYRLLDVAEYGVSHPEYFSLHGGKRIVTKNPKYDMQLCLTNPDVIRIVGDNLLAAIRQDPSGMRYGVAQNDNDVYCECPNCAALDAAEGSHAGSYVHFVNAIADRVKAAFPDKLVFAAAYMYTRKPPKTPFRDNVVLEICPLEADCAHSIATGQYAENVSFRRDVLGWGQKAKNLFIWNYVTDFNVFGMPMPNIPTFQDDLRFYRDAGVNWISPEGPYVGYGADLESLKGWLLAKLMWNPDQDVETLVRRFMKGYYGAAAPYAQAYYDALNRCVSPDGQKWSCFKDPRERTYITDDFIAKAQGLWKQAEESVRDDPARLRAVRLSALGVDVVRFKRLSFELEPASFSMRSRSADEMAKRQEFRALATHIGVLLRDEPQARLIEGQKGEDILRAQIAGAEAGIYPPEPMHRSPTRVVLGAADVQVECKGLFCDVVEDATLHGGSRIVLSNRSNAWCVQRLLNQASFDAQAHYRLRVLVRVRLKENARPTDEAFAAGISDRAEHKASVRRSFPVSSVAPDRWQWYDIASFQPGTQLNFWFASGTFDKRQMPEHPSIAAVDFGLIELTRE